MILKTVMLGQTYEFKDRVMNLPVYVPEVRWSELQQKKFLDS